MEGLSEVRGAAVVVESTFCSLQPVQNIKHIINYLCCCSLIMGHCKQRAAEDKQQLLSRPWRHISFAEKTRPVGS